MASQVRAHTFSRTFLIVWASIALCHKEKLCSTTTVRPLLAHQRFSDKAHAICLWNTACCYNVSMWGSVSCHKSNMNIHLCNRSSHLWHEPSDRHLDLSRDLMEGTRPVSSLAVRQQTHHSVNRTGHWENEYLIHVVMPVDSQKNFPRGSQESSVAAFF